MGGKRRRRRRRRKTGTLNLFLFLKKQPPLKWNIANSSKRLSEVSPPNPNSPSHPAAIVARYAVRWVFLPKSWIFLYFYDFYYIVHVQFLLAKILVFVLAMSAQRLPSCHRCWGWFKHRQLTPEVLIAGKADKFIKHVGFVGVRSHKMLVINHAVLCLCEF